MPGLRSDVDPDGLIEFSVVYTDRAVNHMSLLFRNVVNDISGILKTAYGADACAIVPGSGTFGMEAVARQFATGRKCLVIRNGWFSYRWSQIFEAGAIPAAEIVLKAKPESGRRNAPFAPPPVDEVVATIERERPDLVFAPHVETSSGILLPDDYLRSVADATHAAGGMFVLDCIASGALWTDMRALDIDVVVSAPQKGWSGSPCAGFVMFGQRALARLGDTRSTSFACDLARWLDIVRAYEGGGAAYHATMPTDSLRRCRDVMLTASETGLDVMREAQRELGRRVRKLLTDAGFPSVAAPGFEAPGVVVSYTDDPGIRDGSKFAAAGVQIAAGVPLKCDEPDDFSTFRIGLFGLDKLCDVERTVESLDNVLRRIL